MEDCLEPAVPSGSGGGDEGTEEGGGWRPVKTTNGVQVDFKKAPPGSSGMGSVRLTAEMKAPACQLKMSGQVACILCVTPLHLNPFSQHLSVTRCCVPHAPPGVRGPSLCSLVCSLAHSLRSLAHPTCSYLVRTRHVQAVDTVLQHR